MSRELLGVLSIQMVRQWRDIVTLDESWIYLYCEHDLMWMAPEEIVPDRERQAVQSPKLMPTIVWNPSGFHIVKALSKGGKFSAQYHTNNILIALSDWRRLSGERSPNKGWVHPDNARPHNVKVSTHFIALNRMKEVLHPPYSPDLAPSDFFLLGSVKRKLRGCHAESPSEFVIRIRVILSEIPRETLNAVFLESIERPRKCIDTNGEYVG
jgi:histone-lysine N-methyltransferase SETMAR